MPLIRAAREAIRQARAENIETPALPLTSTTLVDFLNAGHHTAAGVRVNERNSLGLSAVWRSVNLIAGTGASLPLGGFRPGDNGIPLPVGPNTMAYTLLATPHPDLTPFELWEIVYAHLLLWGNAYLRILRDRGGQIRELWPMHPSRVRAGRESETGLKIYEIDGGQLPLFDDGILHIPGFGYDGVCGVSPIRLARQGLGLSMAAEEFGGKLFGSGSLASGILQTEQRLDQDQADQLKKRWNARMSGLANAHDVAVLDSGIKFQQLSIPPGDAQFIEARQFQVAEIGRMFGVPLHMLMQTEKATSWGTGMEQQALNFVAYTLRPWLTRVEQRVTKLLQPGSVYARYDIEGLLRGDKAALAAWYTSMWNIGAFSTNDVRRKLVLEPVEHGDTRYRPLNFGFLGTENATAVPAADPADPAAPAPADPADPAADEHDNEEAMADA